MHRWILLVSVMALAVLGGCGHNPNHDINMEQARAAANRVHPPPPPGVQMMPGAGG